MMTAPTEEELARRQKLVAKILANADKRMIAPMTTADLVHQVRQKREEAYERWAQNRPIGFAIRRSD